MKIVRKRKKASDKNDEKDTTEEPKLYICPDKSSSLDFRRIKHSLNDGESPGAENQKGKLSTVHRNGAKLLKK